MSVPEIIQEAATTEGIPPDVLLRIAEIESGLRPDAQNPNSSAGGLFQFIDSTAKAYGVVDKMDPQQSAFAAAKLARDNADGLRAILGRDPEGWEYYLAHQQGLGGALSLLKNPDRPAVEVLGRKQVLLNGGNESMTAREFADMWRTKFEGERIASNGSEWLPVHDAYISGRMEDGDKAAYLSAIEEGAIPKPVLPLEVYAAYAQGMMSDDERAIIDNILASGIWEVEQRGLGGSLKHGAEIAARAVAEGGADLIGLLNDPVAAAGNAIAGKRVFEDNLSGAVSRGLDRLGIDRPETPAERIVSGAAQVAVGGAGMAGAASKVAKGASGMTRSVAGALADSPTKQVVSSALSGGAAEAAKEAGSGPVTQFLAALGAGAVGAGITPDLARASRGAATRQAEAAVRAGQRNKIPVMTSDVIAPDTFSKKTAQAVGERIPVFGTAGLRAEQAAARRRALAALGDQYDAVDFSVVGDDISEALIRQHGKLVDRLGRQKWNILSPLSGKPVPTPKTISQIDNLIDEFKATGVDDFNPLIAKLVDWRKALAKGRDIVEFDKIRQLAGEVFNGDEFTGSRDTVKAALESLYGPMKEDMGAFIAREGGPEAFARWNRVNSNFTKVFDRLGRTAMRQALNKGEIEPEAVARLIFSGKRSDVQAVFKALPADGRAKARSAIIYKMLNDGEVELSPSRFIRRANKLGYQRGIFFGKREREEMKGLVRVLDATRRADVAALQPPTGVQNTQLIGGAAVGGGGVAAAGIEGAAVAAGGTALAGLAARLFESSRGRKLLLAIGKAEPGSKEEAALIKRIIAAARATDKEDGE